MHVILVNEDDWTNKFLTLAYNARVYNTEAHNAEVYYTEVCNTEV